MRHSIINHSSRIKTKKMKKFSTKVLLMAFILGQIHTATLAQQVNETFIRNLDNSEREAVLRGDTISLFNKLWSPNMVVNTPANRVGTVESTKNLTRTGKIDYSSFERTIEKITIFENVGIVMGQEVVKPQRNADNVGKTITRRFTNIWMNGKDGWQIVARQATVISIL
jgi:Domain of unknown function (DUF4440)